MNSMLREFQQAFGNRIDDRASTNALSQYVDQRSNTPIARGSVLPLTEYADRVEFDSDSGLIGAMKRAFTAPYRAYQGQISDDQMVPEAMNLAGLITLGGYMSPKPANALGTGGGGIKAYHGSPHDFDQFSMEHIGTGEGAQAYGRGLYFAENEGVAKSYRDNLTGGPTHVEVNGERYIPDELDDAAYRLAARAALQYSSPLGWKQFIRRYSKDDETAISAMRLLRDKEVKVAYPGRMYEVRINADPGDFINYDVPVSQQPEKVREAMNSLADKAGIGRGGFNDEIRSGDIDTYRTYIDQSMPSGELEKNLRDIGIPGFRYLDNGSRNNGVGTSNYVVFDDSLIEILRKYGLLGPVAAGAVASTLGGRETVY